MIIYAKTFIFEPNKIQNIITRFDNISTLGNFSENFSEVDLLSKRVKIFRILSVSKIHILTQMIIFQNFLIMTILLNFLHLLSNLRNDNLLVLFFFDSALYVF